MRVVLISLSVRGAGGQYTWLLARHLARLCDVCLIVPAHFEFLSQCRQAGITVHCIVTGASRWWALLRMLNPVAAWRSWLRIGSFHPSLIHVITGNSYPPAQIWKYLAILRRVPWVVTVHDVEPHPRDIYGFIARMLRNVSMWKVSAVHVHSAKFVPLLQRRSASVKVIPHGSFAELFLPHAIVGAAREKLVLFFGRLEYYKGVDLLVKAARFLDPTVRVVIAGPGRLDEESLRIIAEAPERFELQNRYLDNDEVARLFQRAALCVLPYRQASQSSLPLISAGFKVPVLATSVGAFVEDVPRVGGKLLPAGNLGPEAMACEIMLTLDNGRTMDPPELHFVSLSREFAAWYGEVASGS